MSSPKKSADRPAPAPVPAANASIDEWIDYLRGKVENLAYGSIQIVVHDGRITLVESTEKVRPVAAKPPAKPPAQKGD